MRKLLWRPYVLFCNLFFDPLELVNKYRALPFFVRNWRKYARLNRDSSFKIRTADIWYRAHDRFLTAGTAEGHYFFQDLWAAQTLYDRGVRHHVDVGSRLDGYIAHLLPFCAVTYVDVRPLALEWPNFAFRQGSITAMPFQNDSIPSLSSLHVIEHIGLGRYGDTVDPLGYLTAAAELTRVLAPGGRLLIGTPVGRERLCFDAHRIFDPSTVMAAFSGLRLIEFSLIDDKGKGILKNASFEQARAASYGCGLFVFEK